MHWQGELLQIHVAPNAAAPMEALPEARLVAGIGIEGDRYATRLGTYSKKHHLDRQVTLIEVPRCWRRSLVTAASSLRPTSTGATLLLAVYRSAILWGNTFVLAIVCSTGGG